VSPYIMQPAMIPVDTPTIEIAGYPGKTALSIRFHIKINFKYTRSETARIQSQGRNNLTPGCAPNRINKSRYVAISTQSVTTLIERYLSKSIGYGIQRRSMSYPFVQLPECRVARSPEYLRQFGVNNFFFVHEADFFAWKSPSSFSKGTLFPRQASFSPSSHVSAERADPVNLMSQDAADNDHHCGKDQWIVPV
jgi:hypothetical protein